MEKICENCKYWYTRFTLALSAQCRHNAPIIAPIRITTQPSFTGGQESQGAWPITDKEDFCGKWKERKTGNSPHDNPIA